MTELSKYQQTAQRILELEPFEVEMNHFTSAVLPDSLDEFRQANHECGTTFCIAGKLAQLDDFPERFWTSGHFAFMTYSSVLCGHSVRTNEWDFLFTPNWPDSLDAAKARAAYVLEHDACPPVDTWVKDWGYGA